MMSNIIKCKCGTRDIIKPKNKESVEHFILSKRCPRCGTVGGWRQLSQDEYMWEKAKGQLIFFAVKTSTTPEKQSLL